MRSDDEQIALLREKLHTGRTKQKQKRAIAAAFGVALAAVLLLIGCAFPLRAMMRGGSEKGDRAPMNEAEENAFYDRSAQKSAGTEGESTADAAGSLACVRFDGDGDGREESWTILPGPASGNDSLYIGCSDGALQSECLVTLPAGTPSFAVRGGRLFLRMDTKDGERLYPIRLENGTVRVDGAEN